MSSKNSGSAPRAASSAILDRSGLTNPGFASLEGGLQRDRRCLTVGVGRRDVFMPASGPSTPILFLHGCWHGSWCRAEVLAQVTGVGAGRWPLIWSATGRAPGALLTRTAP
jgi:hypothetical protein